jgi:hypothetical protein
VIKYDDITFDQAMRFWSKVKKGPDENGPNTCWRWTAGLFADGYPKVKVNGVTYRASHVAFVLQNGPLEEGEQVLHHCDQPLCLRGSHLFAGSHLENMQDKVRKGRHIHGTQHVNNKLTPTQVVSIRAEVAAGQTLAVTARKFEVSEKLIWNIVNRKTWKHIP